MKLYFKKKKKKNERIIFYETEFKKERSFQLFEENISNHP